MASCLERLGISVSGERVEVDEATANQISQACISSDEDSQGSSSSSESDDDSLEEDCESVHCEVFQPKKQPSVKHSGDPSSDKGPPSTSLQSKKDLIFRDMDLVNSLVSSMPSFDCLSEDLCKDDCSSASSVIDKVNLDITSLITLVSSVTNGGCHFDFSEKVLAMQASEERREPVLPKLKKFLQGEVIKVKPSLEYNTNQPLGYSFLHFYNTVQSLRHVKFLVNLHLLVETPGFANLKYHTH